MKSVILVLLVVVFMNSDKLDPVPSAVYGWNDFKVTKQETRENRPIFEGSTTHLEYFESHATTLYPGKMPHAQHTHETDEELILVRQGQINITTDKTSKTIGPGGIAFIIPGEEHGLENAGDEKAIYYIIKYRSKVPMNVGRSVMAGGSILLDRSELSFNEHDKGGRWNYFDRSTASCVDFEMHATRLNPKISSHAPHTHAQEEIILMLEGEALMHIDGKDYPTSVGDVIFLDSNVPHGITNTGDDPCEYFAFQWR